MLLQTKDGQVFMIHFHHEAVDARLVSHRTSCTVHLGLCTEKKRPCNTKDSITAFALTSRKDNFDKAKGRKLALSRALTIYARELRAELWAEYLKINPPKKNKH